MLDQRNPTHTNTPVAACLLPPSGALARFRGHTCRWASPRWPCLLLRPSQLRFKIARTREPTTLVQRVAGPTTPPEKHLYISLNNDSPRRKTRKIQVISPQGGVIKTIELGPMTRTRTSQADNHPLSSLFGSPLASSALGGLLLLPKG